VQTAHKQAHLFPSSPILQIGIQLDTQSIDSWVSSALSPHKAFNIVQWTSDIRTSDIRTLAYRDTPKHVPAKVVLCNPRLLIRTLAYKDTKMLAPAVSLYPRFTVHRFPSFLQSRFYFFIQIMSEDITEHVSKARSVTAGVWLDFSQFWRANLSQMQSCQSKSDQFLF
jgi:hypothetical protein